MEEIDLQHLHADALVTVELAVARDATVVTATGIIEDEVFTWTAASKLAPGDDFDREIAVKLAVGRALEKAGKQLQRQGNGLVKCRDDNRRQSELAKAQRKATKTKVHKTTGGTKVRVVETN